MTAVNLLSGALYAKGLLFKEKAQLYGIALLFLVLLYNSPACLVLYWTMNNVFSLIKNCYLKIPFHKKNLVIKIALTALCAVLALYLATDTILDKRKRMLISLLCSAAALIPWCIPVFKKIAARLFRAPYHAKYEGTLFVLSLAAIWLLLGVALPASLIAASPQEFSYIDSYSSPLFFIGNTALQCAGVFLFWPLCLFFLFSEKIKKVFALCAVVFAAIMLCNAFLFPGNYGVLSIGLLFQNDVAPGRTETAFNLAVLAGVAAAAAALFFSRFRRVLTIAAGLCITALAGLQVFHIQKIQEEYRALSALHTNDALNVVKTTVEPILPLSKTGKNVVFIMFDRGHSSLVPFIFEEKPELYDEYSGFTYYPNTVSFHGHTSLGAPPLYGGYEYTPEEINKRGTVHLVQKHNEALTMLPLLFSENGFTVTVTDQPYANYNEKIDISIYDRYPQIQAHRTDSAYTDVWLKEHNMNFPSTSDMLKRNMFYYSVFRSSPVALRALVYGGGIWGSPISTRWLRDFLNAYSALDYLSALTRIETDDTNCFLLLTNNTTHERTFLQAPDYHPELTPTNLGTGPFKDRTTYHINAAALQRLGDWFSFLKAEGLYDNTRIIIVSDHGEAENFVHKSSLPFKLEQFNPLLMVKDFGASGAMQTNRAFMSNADAPFLAAHGVIPDEKMKNPFTGQAISRELKKEPLYIAVSGSLHLSKKTATRFLLDRKRDYSVHDDIFDEANWQKVE